MMTKIIRTGIAAAALLAAPIAAQAADLSRPNYKAPAYSAPAYVTWSGFYAGINGGYGFGKGNVSTVAGSTGDFNLKGAVAGATLGYNFQTGIWVWGLEGDIDYSGIKGTSSSFCTGPCTVSNNWLATARARVGYGGWDRWLPYITGGAAFGNVKREQNGASESQSKLGWTAGLGLEYAFLGNWTAKVEYLYVDLGSATPVAVTTKFNTNLVRVGLNYRF